MSDIDIVRLFWPVLAVAFPLIVIIAIISADSFHIKMQRQDSAGEFIWSLGSLTALLLVVTGALLWVLPADAGVTLYVK